MLDAPRPENEYDAGRRASSHAFRRRAAERGHSSFYILQHPAAWGWLSSAYPWLRFYNRSSFSLFFDATFYYICQRIAEKTKPWHKKTPNLNNRFFKALINKLVNPSRNRKKFCNYLWLYFYLFLIYDEHWNYSYRLRLGDGRICCFNHSWSNEIFVQQTSLFSNLLSLPGEFNVLKTRIFKSTIFLGILLQSLALFGQRI